MNETVAALAAKGEEEWARTLSSKRVSPELAKKLLVAYKLERLYADAGETVFLDALMAMFDAQGVKVKLSLRWPRREERFKIALAEEGLSDEGKRVLARLRKSPAHSLTLGELGASERTARTLVRKGFARSSTGVVVRRGNVTRLRPETRLTLVEEA